VYCLWTALLMGLNSIDWVSSIEVDSTVGDDR
jgi:hypothetical protein